MAQRVAACLPAARGGDVMGCLQVPAPVLAGCAVAGTGSPGRQAGIHVFSSQCRTACGCELQLAPSHTHRPHAPFDAPTAGKPPRPIVYQGRRLTLTPALHEPLTHARPAAHIQRSFSFRERRGAAETSRDEKKHKTSDRPGTQESIVSAQTEHNITKDTQPQPPSAHLTHHHHLLPSTTSNEPQRY